MTDDRSLERAARSWLEGGPLEAPDRAVDAALLQIQTTTQERDWHVPWRTRPMNQTPRLLAGGAAIAILLVGGALLLHPGSNIGVGGPSPTIHPTASAMPSASAAASPPAVLTLTNTFTSARHGYSVHYPSGWTVKDATKPWAAIGQNNWGSGINDELSNSTARFSGASQPLSKGQTADQWMTAYANGGATSSWATVAIGGQAGKITFDGVPAAGGTVAPGGVMFDSVVVVGGRGYNFNMDGIVDRPTFEAFLATVVFDPGSAFVVPPMTQHFTSARHGYRISYPTSWTVKPATAPWPGGASAAPPPDPMLDVFTDPADPARSFVIVSQPLATGVTPDAWLATYEASAPSMPADCWPPPAQMERSTIAGQPVWIHGGLSICGFTEAVTFAGGRVYELTSYFPQNGRPLPRDLFDALVKTVTFDPAAADDSPAQSPRPS